MAGARSGGAAGWRARCRVGGWIFDKIAQGRAGRREVFEPSVGGQAALDEAPSGARA